MVRDQQNVKKELYYKKFNLYNEENFDDKLDFDEIEAGKVIFSTKSCLYQTSENLQLLRDKKIKIEL